MEDNRTTTYANSIFEQPWWLDTVAENKWSESVVKDGERVIARLPYVLDGKKILNPPYTQTLGIWFSKELLEFERGNSQLHRQKDIIAELLSQLPKARNIDIELDHSVRYILPFRWHGFRIEPRFSYRIMNLKDYETVKSRIGKTVNKNVKAAQRNITVEEDSKDYECMLELQCMTYARQNRKPPYPDEFTLKVMKNSVENGAGRLMIAKDESGIAHGAVFLLYDHNTCYYLLGGQNPDYKSDGSQNLLLVKAIEFASTVSDSFDFEGSMIEGVENFFRQFGGEQIVYYRVYRQSAIGDALDALKPHVKKTLGYKI